MRFALLAIFCLAISFTASAQFWHRKPKPEEQRFPLLDEVTFHSPVSFTAILSTPGQDIRDLELSHGDYVLELAEDLVMTEAKHNMRYRIYNLASYNFSDLAALYMQQNRFSEAKWYLLQSNEISRQQNDIKHTLSNLLALADIKVQLGEIALAKLDLQEARDIANAKGMQADITEIDKRIKYLQTSKVVKAEMRYAEAVEAANGKTGVN
jgi:hypothetical protein